jgi:fructan beta-fructosidase
LVGYDQEKRRLIVDRTHSGITNFSPDFPARITAPLEVGEELKLHLLVDHSSVEVFAMDGRVAMTNLIFPEGGIRKVESYSQEGQSGLVHIVGRPLRSIW